MQQEGSSEEIRFRPPEGYEVDEIILRKRETRVIVGKPEDLEFTPFQLPEEEVSPLLRFSRITANHAPAILNLVNRQVDLDSFSSREKSPFDDCEQELIPEIEALSRVPPVELFRRTVNIFTGPGGPGLTEDVAQAVASAYMGELRRIYESIHAQ